jgi:thiol-disulfide isomerase/thioredoxin
VGDAIILGYSTTGHAMDPEFKAFADLVADLAPRIRAKKDGDATVSLPTLFIGSHVGYQALPLDHELEPFLAALSDGGAFAERIVPDVRLRLAQLRAPALVKVYITPHCPFCPATVCILLGLAACSDQVRVTVIDGERFPDAAQKDRVTAAPTVILDDQFRWIGSVDAGELVAIMLDRDPAGLGAEALRGMIEDGNAEGVARMMEQRGTLFPAFIELLAHPRWSVRLGAMVSFETLVELNPELAANVVEPLMRVFADTDDTVKGDLIHVLGESGNIAALPFLSTVATGGYDEEIQSAAMEAIEKLS